MLLREVILAGRPVSYWPLDDKAGNLVDIVGGRNGTLTGSVVRANRTLGPGAPGLYADFFGGHIDIADASAFSPHAGASGLMSVEATFIGDALGNATMLVAKGNSSNFEFRLNSHTDGTLTGIVSDLPGTETANVATSAAGAVAVGRLCHGGFTYDKAANLLITYVDGREVARDTALTVTSGDGTASLQIGRRADGGGSVWDGVIGHAAIYARVLGPAEWQARAAALFAGIPRRRRNALVS